MYWLRRPPYLRYLAAALILAGAAWLEFRQPALVLHPSATEPVPVGVSIEEASIEWREIPTGLLPPVSGQGVTRRRVPSGHPLLPADIDSATQLVPDGWWALEVQLTDRAQVGQQVQLVVMTPAGTSAVPGVVLEASDRGSGLDFGESLGLVAVPPEEAVSVAVASVEGRLAVLVDP